MIAEETQRKIESRIAELPIVQYAFIGLDQLQFSERVRYICRTECPQYGRSWACPPAVGTLEECRERCLSYDCGFAFISMTEVKDIANMEETLSTRAGHEALTREVCRIFREEGFQVTALSTESCAICETCAYPDGPCRHPDQMFPCVESYGILATDIAEKLGIEFINGMNLVTWFSLVLIA